ncbi:glycosyltransferase [Pedobacter mucosus]|uniref:glycosyltransferase n=1 Tax=Pedobacter mucosus TaxID=2895286 RepID=UPI001EE3B1BB|nr:glycosyltransferase [Pedobacter mucosus]UKT62599.1 glycosyltransferase [Pedobacter mucosus]
MRPSNSRLKIFTWHIHGSYLFYLSQGDYDIYIPVNNEKSEGYVGRGETYLFGDNVHEIEASAVRELDLDVIIFQTDENYLYDQYQILSDFQQTLPRIYLEHDPPWDHPTNAKHPLKDPSVMLVHVTHFNAIMWDAQGIDYRVVEHGVMPATALYTGEIERGIVVINNLPSRGRLLGLDIFEEVRKKIPLDLVGMGAEAYGIGEVLHPNLPEFVSKYRFFFNPIRYTSLGLAVCEAMMQGMPIVGLATTEMAVTLKNGYSGFINTNINTLIDNMEFLLNEPSLAKEIGHNAKLVAEERFNIMRFTNDWTKLFYEITSKQNVHNIM